MKRRILAWLIVVTLVVGIGLALVSHRAVAPRSAEASAEVFSATRAWSTIEAIAQRPHPSGSEEIVRVREHLVAELEGLGLEVEVEHRVAHRDLFWATATGPMANIVARRPGREPGQAVLLVAHYDSVPTGPGAADDGAGVATLVEVARALVAGEPTRNDVIFLFTDGEEPGLLGAQAFADESPWMERVGVVLNFEARGIRGPVLMFETGRANRQTIAALASAEHPVGNSFSRDIYRRMPNDTDFTVFRRRGLPGLNFAFVHGLASYHTAQDNLENLDPSSLQQMGDCALAATRQLAEGDLAALQTGGDAVYFNLGPFFVRYPASLVRPLALVLALATLLAFGVALKRKRTTLGRTLLASLLVIVLAVAAAAVLFFAGRSIFGPYPFTLGAGSSFAFDLLGLVLIAGALLGWVGYRLGRWLGGGSVVAGGLFFWLLLTLASGWMMPGASYLFAWPLLLGLVGLAVVPETAEDEPGERVSPVAAGVLLLGALVVPLLWTPVLGLAAVALGFPAVALFGLVAVPLLVGVLGRQTAVLGALGRPLVLGSSALGLVVLVVVALSAGHDDTVNRRTEHLTYYADTEAGTARWLSFNARLGPWARGVLGENPEWARRPVVFGPSPRPVAQAEAPVSSRAQVPTVEVVGNTLETAEDGTEVRHLELRLAWPTPVDRALLLLRSDNQILANTPAGAPRQPHERQRGPGTEASRLILYVVDPDEEGLRTTFEMVGDEELVMEVYSQTFGFPDDIEGPGERPAGVMPSSQPSTDSTYVRSLHTLDVTTPLAPADGSEPGETEGDLENEGKDVGGGSEEAGKVG